MSKNKKIQQGKQKDHIDIRFQKQELETLVNQLEAQYYLEYSEQQILEKLRDMLKKLE